MGTTDSFTIFKTLLDKAMKRIYMKYLLEVAVAYIQEALWSALTKSRIV